MNFKEYLESRRKYLFTFLKDFVSQEKRLADDGLSDVALKRLTAFSTKGKMLRGVFVMLGYEMFAGIKNPTLNESQVYPYPNVLNVAAAMELSHSALLIHDDIMDNDLTRRGDKTIFSHYIDDAVSQNIADPEEYGKSMGMVVGDASFFLTYELMGNVDVTPVIRSRIMHRYSKELLKVTLGQFLDYHYGRTHQERSSKEITRMYHLKTGAYTFTLPCILGAYLAGKTDRNIENLEKLTGNLGEIFQIKDDELGLFGDPAKTGKPVGSDIAEDKKTLFRAALLDVASEDEKKKLDTIFGKKVYKKDLLYVQDLLTSYGIISQMQKRVNELSEEAQILLGEMEINDTYKNIFGGMIAYNASRGT